MPDGQQPTIERRIRRASDDRPGLLVRTPFYQGFVDDLKSELPVPDRSWDEERQAWWVASRHEDRLVQLVVRAFGGCRIIDEAGDEVVDAHGRARQERLL